MEKAPERYSHKTHPATLFLASASFEEEEEEKNTKQLVKDSKKTENSKEGKLGEIEVVVCLSLPAIRVMAMLMHSAVLLSPPPPPTSIPTFSESFRRLHAVHAEFKHAPMHAHTNRDQTHPHNGPFVCSNHGFCQV